MKRRREGLQLRVPREFPSRWVGVSDARETNVKGQLGSAGCREEANAHAGAGADRKGRPGRTNLARRQGPVAAGMATGAPLRVGYALGQTTGPGGGGSSLSAARGTGRSTTAGRSMNAMMRRGPAHRGHTSGATSYSYLINRAQACFAARLETSLDSSWGKRPSPLAFRRFPRFALLCQRE